MEIETPASNGSEHGNADTDDEKQPFASVVDRYFTRLFKVNLPQGTVDPDNFKSNMNDVQILWHSNKICIVTLAPTHPALASGRKIVKVDFKVTLKCNRANNNVSGKRKRGAQWLNPESPLCLITTEGGETSTVHPGIRGHLIEVNENLIKNPGLLQQKPETEGYIAIVMIKLEERDNLTRGLMSELEYKDYLKLLK